MQERLDSGIALDVNVIGTRLPDGTYLLYGFMDDVDYCDPDTESWVWTIGVHRETGEYRAAFDMRFMDHPEYKLLWLR
jgi:hypothetical protein